MSRPQRPDVLAKRFDESKVKRDEEGKFATKPGVINGVDTGERLGTYRKRGGRPGGDRRGNTTDRRRRKEWMLRHWGDGEKAPCTHCDAPLHYETIEADRIEPGGSYRRSNVQPSCRGCNLARADDVDWDMESEREEVAARASVGKHYGPGPHKSGTPQSVHGKKGGAGLTSQMMTQPEGERGYSYDRRQNRFAEGTGFALSVFPEHEVIIPQDEHMVEAIDAYVNEHWEMVRNDDRAMYGAWFNEETGNVELDISIVVQDREEAEQLAMEYQQEAYYDIEAGETVRVRARDDRYLKAARASAAYG